MLQLNKMECIVCKKTISCKLSIHTEIEDRPISVVYQWWSCDSCSEKYFGIYEENSVNLFADSYEHIGYQADKQNWERSFKSASKCPKPRNVKCLCEVHQSMPPSEFCGTQAWYSCS